MCKIQSKRIFWWVTTTKWTKNINNNTAIGANSSKAGSNSSWKESICNRNLVIVYTHPPHILICGLNIRIFCPWIIMRSICHIYICFTLYAYVWWKLLFKQMRPIREIGIQFVMKTGRLQYRIVNWWSEIASLVRLIAISFFFHCHSECIFVYASDGLQSEKPKCEIRDTKERKSVYVWKNIRHTIFDLQISGYSFFFCFLFSYS